MSGFEKVGETSKQGNQSQQLPKSRLERRKEERIRNDPHHFQPFKRFYIGPSPIAAKSAASVASAIAKDVQIERPTSIGIIGSTGTIAAAALARQSIDSIAIQSQTATDEIHSIDAGSIHGQPFIDNLAGNNDRRSSLKRLPSHQSLQSNSSSPVKAYRELSPIRIPGRSGNVNQSRTTSNQQKRLHRDSSFASARSAGGNVEGIERRGSVQMDEDAHGILRNRSSRRQLSQSLAEPRIGHQHDTVKFNLQDPRKRRQHSEGGIVNEAQNTNHARSRVLPLLDTSVHEEEGFSTSYSPEKGRATSPSRPSRSEDGLLRPTSSHRSLGNRFRNPERKNTPLSVRLKASDRSIRTDLGISDRPISPNAKGIEGKERPSDPATTGQDTTASTELPGEHLSSTNDTQPEHSSSSRMDELRQKARERYRQSKVNRQSSRIPSNATGQRMPEHVQGKRRQHIRDASRQSRLSYISTVGTLTSVGTRFTEGSFGAQGGFRAKLVRSFKLPSKQSKNPSIPNLKLEAHRKGRRSSNISGVIPGAVGTSAGGTKWVGQTFEVGKRFWQSIENREELLLGGDFALDDVPEEEIENGTDANKKDRPDRQKSDSTADMRSPDDVLHSFAREASEAVEGTDESNRKKRLHRGASTDQNVVKSTDAVRADVGKTPALIQSGSDSEPSDGLPVTPERNGNHRRIERKNSEGLMPSKININRDHELERVRSNTSLQSVPQDQEVQSSWDIESRIGWSDVVSFMSAQSSLPSSIQRSARSAGDNLNDFGTKAKRVFDGQLSDYRARQVAAKQAREKGRAHELSRTMIRESSQGSEEINRSKTPLIDQNSERQVVKMSQKEAWNSPEPPMEAEEKFPEATFELTRRASLPGFAPNGEQNDAASDHEIAARPTFTEEPERIQDIGREINLLQLPSSEIRSDQQKHSPIEIPFEPIDGETPAANTPEEPMASILNMKSSFNNGEKKAQKMVSFLGSSPSGPKRSVTMNEIVSPSNSESAANNLAGRFRPIVRMGNAAPAPPEEVLLRDSTPDEKVKNGKTLNEADLITSRSILKRDRILVKLMWTASEDVPKEFTERESRKYELHADPFREFMVVLRMGRLELWDDPSWTSRLIGKSDNLRLRYVAPLRKGHASVSLYSAVDTIFCLSFIPAHHRGLFNLRKSGTHIWLFDARSASNSADWMWDLWRELGGQIPEAIDVHIPVLGFRVRIPIPDEIPLLQRNSNQKSIRTTTKPGVRSLFRATDGNDDDGEDDSLLMEGGEGYKLINHKNVVKVVSQLAHFVPQWAELCARLEERGLQFGLAWRTHSTLSWVQYVNTVDLQRRDWSVLVGSILCDHKSPSTLEFRAATHYPQSVRTVTGEALQEPPAIEGFLWRVKAVSGALTRLYITTQDGLIFVNRPSRAFPPERYIAIDQSSSQNQYKRSDSSVAELSIEHRRRTRRGSKGAQRADDTLATLGKKVIEMITTEAQTIEELDAQMEAYRAFEKRRLFEQIANSDGYVDVRDIYSIHSLDGRGGIRRPNADGRDAKKSALNGDHLSDEFEDVFDDIGGEEGYEQSQDRNALKKSRQFEVTMMNGRTIRFEAYSQSVCHEWVNQIYALSLYWKRREKVDALEVMNACGHDPTLIHRTLKKNVEVRPLDSEAGSERVAPILGNIWNWCILDGCRTILRSGRLFTKKKPYTAFASRYCVLVSGRILTFKLMTSNRTARSRQNAGIFHKRQDTVIHLRDSYIYSGKLSDHMLVNGRSDGAGALSNFGGGTGGATTSSTRHTLPRIYADGLLSTDEDEECTFVIRYRPQRVNRSLNPHLHNEQDAFLHGEADDQTNGNENGVTQKVNASITTLRDSTVNVIAMRARSRLERDLWVWAINAERERVVRDDVARENQIRQHGQTPFKHGNHSN